MIDYLQYLDEDIDVLVPLSNREKRLLKQQSKPSQKFKKNKRLKEDLF